MSHKEHPKKRFKIRVAGVALHQGRLLIHQFEDSEYWSLPGGNIEMGETSAEGLVRELKEEADLDVEVDRLLWVHENYFVRRSGKQVHEICFYYFIKLKNAEQGSFQGAEGDLPLYFRWAPIDQLSSINLVPAFLKTRIHLLPGSPEHLVTFEKDSKD